MILKEKAELPVFSAMPENPVKSSTLPAAPQVAHKVIHRNCVEVLPYRQKAACLKLAHRSAIRL
jgi:hypothetical protein